MQVKRIVRAGLIALALSSAFAVAASAQETQIKIAVVDLERIVAQSQAGKELQGQLEAFQKTVQGEIERLNAQANDIRKRVAEGGNSLSQDKIAELQKEFEDAQIAARRYRDDKQREGQKLQTEGLQKIEQQLEPVFEQIKTEMQLDLLLNYVPGVVVMASDKVDITDQVIGRVNAALGGGQ